MVHYSFERSFSHYMISASTRAVELERALDIFENFPDAIVTTSTGETADISAILPSKVQIKENLRTPNEGFHITRFSQCPKAAVILKCTMLMESLVRARTCSQAKLNGVRWLSKAFTLVADQTKRRDQGSLPSSKRLWPKI